MSRTSADVFRAIADPTRRALLDLLQDDDYPALQLADRFSLTQPAISQHLRVLKDAGLVSERRVGRQRIYRLEAKPLRQVNDWVAHFEQFWGTKLEALRRHLDQNPESTKKR